MPLGPILFHYMCWQTDQHEWTDFFKTSSHETWLIKYLRNALVTHKYSTLKEYQFMSMHLSSSFKGFISLFFKNSISYTRKCELIQQICHLSWKDTLRASSISTIHEQWAALHHLSSWEIIAFTHLFVEIVPEDE